MQQNSALISETEKSDEKNMKNGNNEKINDLQGRKKGAVKEKEEKKNDKNDDSVWNLEGPEFDPMAVLGLTLKIQKVNYFCYFG